VDAGVAGISAFMVDSIVDAVRYLAQAFSVGRDWLMA
jgi:hypothetical protein